jgi:hypothetical protein
MIMNVHFLTAPSKSKKSSVKEVEVESLSGMFDDTEKEYILISAKESNKV